MRHPRQPPMKRVIISIAAACAIAALPGCSAASLATASPSPGAARTAWAAFHFTVAGDNPVLPSGSQDTHAQTAGTACDTGTFASDEALGTRIADGFELAGFPVAAALLAHFLKGTGTAVNYRAGSRISKEALASTAFRSLNSEIQQAILSQLKTGRTQVRLSAAQLPAVAFESKSSELYWAFRGTQGLTVTGSGSRVNGRYAGTVTYVIRDSYGFPADDTLDGFGPPMRYLQTVCGAPQHPGGAHWFPDTVTVTVPLGDPIGGPSIAE
jgi:hypothetical protein